MSGQCRASVSRGAWHTGQCYRKAVKDGYCTQHHPDAENARREESRRRYERDVAERALEREAVVLLRNKGYTVIPPAFEALDNGRKV